MTLSTRSARSTNLTLTAAIVGTAVWSILFVLLLDSKAGRAEDKKDTEAKTDETDPEFAVPDGTPAEIFEFVGKLRSRPPRFANAKERVDFIIKMHRAFISAGDKVLNQECEEEDVVNAVRLKMESLTILAINGIGDAAKEAMEAADKLKEDKRAGVRKALELYIWPIRIANVATLTDEGRKSLVTELLTAVEETKFSPLIAQAAQQLGSVLSSKGHADEAGELFDSLARLAKESGDHRIIANAERFEATARRLRLPGHFMSLEGKVLNGEDFDWASYRGKVVLVDFWATWCGPCVGELPNVKENYKKYHEKGFDVVGISLDQARTALDRFIEKEEIPWTQLYDEEIQKGKGWNHPLALYYGINSIPAAILVDQKGHVVSMTARGEELSKLLEQLLGKVE